jgi:putative restriction endonuclease
VRIRIAKYRKLPIGQAEDPVIGCILLEEPFFFEERDWIPIPSDFKAGIQMGKSYDMETGTGLMLWQEVTERLNGAVARHRGPQPGIPAGVGVLGRALVSPGPATIAAAEQGARFGRPQIVTPRLGQGSFRLLVADAYGRRCTMTAERTLPALEAAHIHRYSRGGDHSLSNGLLLRSDLHKLFDLGYLTIEPSTLKIRVSRRIREEFENGRDYYRLDGQPLRQPDNQLAIPSIEKLKYHYENEFRG